MRRDRLPFSISLEEHIGKAQSNIECKVLVRAGCGGAASDHGCRAEYADRHFVNSHALHAKGPSSKYNEQHVRARQDAAVRLRDAPLRREDALDERTILLYPRAGELLLDVAKVVLVFHNVVTHQWCSLQDGCFCREIVRKRGRAGASTRAEVSITGAA